MATSWSFPDTKTGLTVQNVRDDYLFGLVLNDGNGVDYQDREIWAKLRAAEDGYERQLCTRFSPTVIISEPTNEETFDEEEPAYDYDDDFFASNRWGDLKLRTAPVRSVQKFYFGWPNRQNVAYDVPQSWIRLDKQFGLIRLVPDSAAVYATFTSYLLSLFRGGAGVPQSIFVNYTAGFTRDELNRNHNDLLLALKKRAVIDVIAIMAAQLFQRGDSQSRSADGLSQSRSGGASVLRATWERYQADDKAFIQSWRDTQKGIVMAVA